MRNLRFALRNLWQSPMVSAVAILSLALGIGANTAMFSMFEQILLRKLPVPRPNELLIVTSNGPKSGSNSTNNAGGTESIFSYPMYRDLERMQTSFTGIGAFRSTGVNLAYGGQTSSTGGMFVSGSYFPVMGVTPAAGRLLTPDDDKNPGEHRVVVLSHAYWKEKFNADASLIGKTMLVNGIGMTILGVAPEGFTGTTIGTTPSVFVPISMREVLSAGWKGLAERRNYWIYTVARLKPGVTREQAQAALHGTYMGIIRDVELKLQSGISERGRKAFLEQRLTLIDGSHGQSSIRDSGKAALYLLLAITGFVLLIACANIANLLLAKSANRAKEFSIRLSLGATRGQLMGQLLTESVVLGLLAGIAGLFVAELTLLGIQSFFAADDRQLIESATRPATILFAMGLSIAAGILFGLFPAMHSTRMDLAGAMKDQAGNVSSSGAAARFRRVLVTAQIAVSLLLLISAGMFLKSLLNILEVKVGMRTENVIAFGLSPALNQYTPARSRALFEQLEAKAAAIPGVEGVSISMVPLISGNNWGSNVSVDGFQAGPDTDTHSMYNEIGPNFLRLMRIPLVKGREFNDSDSLTTPKVALVNEAFERKFGNGRSLLNRYMQRGSGGKNNIQIVGIVKDAKYSSVKSETPPMFYVPYRQDDGLGSASVYIASAVPVDNVLPAIRRVVAEIDPNLPMEDVKTLQTQVSENIGLDRMISTLAAGFAGLATALAAVGLYGVLAFTVARRTREIGIRLAVGADSGNIRNLILRDVIWMLAIGIGVGLPAAYGLMRYAESLLYEIRNGDPLILIVGVLLLCAVSLLAAYIPARRAMKVEPLEALRYD